MTEQHPPTRVVQPGTAEIAIGEALTEAVEHRDGVVNTGWFAPPLPPPPPGGHPSFPPPDVRAVRVVPVPVPPRKTAGDQAVTAALILVLLATTAVLCLLALLIAQKTHITHWPRHPAVATSPAHPKGR